MHLLLVSCVSMVLLNTNCRKGFMLLTLGFSLASPTSHDDTAMTINCVAFLLWHISGQFGMNMLLNMSLPLNVTMFELHLCSGMGQYQAIRTQLGKFGYTLYATIRNWTSWSMPLQLQPKEAGSSPNNPNRMSLQQPTNRFLQPSNEWRGTWNNS